MRCIVVDYFLPDGVFIHVEIQLFRNDDKTDFDSANACFVFMEVVFPGNRL